VRHESTGQNNSISDTLLVLVEFASRRMTTPDAAVLPKPDVMDTGNFSFTKS
jgi:hypothetical protein